MNEVEKKERNDDDNKQQAKHKKAIQILLPVYLLI